MTGEYVLIIEKGDSAHTFDLLFWQRERERGQHAAVHHKLYGLYINHSDIPPGDPMLCVVPQILCCSPDEGT